MAAETSIPYLTAHGNLTKALERIREAATPSRFTQDFLETKLSLKGGSARPVIPFLKRTGFLGSDGAPTDLYRRFRGTEAQSGAAAAEAMRVGYAPLYEVNEYVHEVSDPDLKRIIVQVTGAEPESSTVQGMVGSFKALRAFANFDIPADAVLSAVTPADSAPAREIPSSTSPSSEPGSFGGIRLGYTINLNLPATSDIAVFDAIFKSLREHILPS